MGYNPIEEDEISEESPVTERVIARVQELWDSMSAEEKIDFFRQLYDDEESMSDKKVRDIISRLNDALGDNANIGEPESESVCLDPVYANIGAARRMIQMGQYKNADDCLDYVQNLIEAQNV